MAELAKDEFSGRVRLMVRVSQSLAMAIHAPPRDCRTVGGCCARCHVVRPLGLCDWRLKRREGGGEGEGKGGRVRGVREREGKGGGVSWEGLEGRGGSAIGALKGG